MHWIVQNNLFHEDGYQTMIDTFERWGISYSQHKVIPFVGELEPIPELNTKNVMCMGSYSMRHVAKKNGWSPGVFDLFDVNFNVQMEHWGRFMLNADSEVLPFKSVILTEASFIRPIDDSKYFSGAVFDPEEFAEWQEKVCVLKEDFGSSLTGEVLVQICKPKKIYSEVRFWIVDDEIVTASQYKVGSLVRYSNQVDSRFITMANALCKRISVDYWRPADAYVVDLCETPDGIKIVELNTINSSGFYAADVQKLIMTLHSTFNGEK